MQVKQLYSDSFVPTKKSTGAAGYDLIAPKGGVLSTGLNTVRIGIQIALPPGNYGRIACRSSLAAKNISVEAGVIDNDYRGEIIVLLRNHSEEPYHYRKGHRIAQLILTPYTDASVMVVDELTETARGDGGFGSTGK
jgi:dUTP pyrophosphatase